MNFTRKAFAIAAVLLAAVASVFAIQAVQTARRAASPPLASLLPQGALLTIESPDFAALLSAWNASPEQAAWLKSANYTVFSNSRLFGRLNDAQGEFTAAANIPADASFLKQVAGKQSIFAWYDIGNLQFLYLTRMSPAQSAQTALLQSRGKFSHRQVGTTPFYIRTAAATEGGATRTVAFAVTGDWLLLATREDLLVQSLQLLQKSSTDSVATEPWFQVAQDAAKPAANAPTPDLHMVLNLDRLVPTPYFRSYWVQQNRSEMKQYSSAVADLYREPTQFREERVLIPKASASSAAAPDSNLTELTALVPPETGFFRAALTQDAATTYATLEDKLLARSIGKAPTGTAAPDADLTAASAGSASDLETRIDAPESQSPQANEVPALRQLLSNQGLEATLTLQSASEPESNGLWIPFHSAILLRASKPWDQTALEAALQQDLRNHLTAASLGLEWAPQNTSGQLYQALTGAEPLQLAVDGDLCILTDDPALMTTLLTRLHARLHLPNISATEATATLIAGVDHTTQRPPYLRLTSLLDRTGTTPAGDSAGVPPAFFSRNIGSLSGAFAPLASERLTERPDGPNLHQTVTYQWQH